MKCWWSLGSQFKFHNLNYHYHKEQHVLFKSTSWLALANPHMNKWMLDQTSMGVLLSNMFETKAYIAIFFFHHTNMCITFKIFFDVIFHVYLLKFVWVF